MMTQYRCTVCGTNVIESDTVPESCTNCTASFALWQNLATGGLEKAKKEEIKTSTTTYSGPKKTVVKKPVAPVYTPPVIISPPVIPKVSKTSNWNYFISELKSAKLYITNSIRKSKVLLFIISLLIFIVASNTSYLKFGTLFVVTGLSLLFITIIIFSKTVLNRGPFFSAKHYTFMGKILGILIFLTLISIPGNFIRNFSSSDGSSDYDNQISETKPETSETNTNQVDKNGSNNPISENEDVKLLTNERVIFYPFVDLSSFFIKEEERGFFEEVFDFFKGLLGSSGFDNDKAYYASTFVNFRNNPSDKSTIIKTLYPGEEIQFLSESEGDWLKAKSEEKIGWLFDDERLYLENKPNIKCVVSKSVVNIRSSPEMGSNIISKVKRNETYRFIMMNSTCKWCLIEDSKGNRGWIYISMVDF